MKKSSIVKTTGFQENRSKNTVTRSGTKKKRDEEEEYKPKLRLKKIREAESDLVEVMRATKVRNPKDHTTSDDEDEDGDIISPFARDFNFLRAQVLSSEFNAEAAERVLLKALFLQTMDLIPLAEIAFRTTKKEQAGYVFINMQKQGRELASELKMLGNVESQVQFIKGSIIEPLNFALGQNFIEGCLNLKHVADTETDRKTAIKIKREIDQLIISIGSFIDKSKMSMIANIASYLAGDISFMRRDEEEQGGLGKRKRRKNG